MHHLSSARASWWIKLNRIKFNRSSCQRWLPEIPWFVSLISSATHGSHPICNLPPLGSALYTGKRLFLQNAHAGSQDTSSIFTERTPVWVMNLSSLQTLDPANIPRLHVYPSHRIRARFRRVLKRTTLLTAVQWVRGWVTSRYSAAIVELAREAQWWRLTHMMIGLKRFEIESKPCPVKVVRQTSRKRGPLRRDLTSSPATFLRCLRTNARVP